MADSTPSSHVPRRRSVNVRIPVLDPADPEGPTVDMVGTLDIPPGVPRHLSGPTPPIAIAAHCFTCNRRSPGVARISTALAERGIACLRVDFPGLGDSGGEFHRTTLSSNAANIVSAARWLEANYRPPRLLIGHSLGGSAVMRAAMELASITTVATIGAPFDPSHAAVTIADIVGIMVRNPNIQAVQLPGRGVKIGRALLEDLPRHNSPEVLRQLGERGVNLLLLHSPKDLIVPFRDARRLWDAAYQPASLISLPEVDHLLTGRKAGRRVGDLIATWAEPLL
ncbi:alpha/beta hydrolase family protein [Corynebacterium heidelbergense]|uniref:Alpha/beta hydrolase n=1 Tax=Corynebacterium heidelbergense TaxID=2055947 RepID=A0A364VCI6_9CORY|nr:alpha/beta hydrolase [Corynebacterium heidelbergense]RAV34365.1 alpha/beta hydrolase [Corynebacterium heidelbergense]WCZ36485.1 Alpha/beta hydrolase family protein [Corynebacterium heidelbergense]